MSEYEMLQYAGLGAGAIVFALVVYGLARFFKAQGAIFPVAAKHYGLAYTQDNQGNVLSNKKYVDRLQGVVDGIPLNIAASYETRGNTKIKSTWFATVAPAGWPACTVNVARTAPKAKAHLVPSGDAAFDRLRFVTCDNAVAAKAMLVPDVRAALLLCPQYDLRVVVDPPNLVLSYGGTPLNAAELRGPIDVVLALARVGG